MIREEVHFNPYSVAAVGYHRYRPYGGESRYHSGLSGEVQF